MEKYRFVCDTCDTPIMTQYDGKEVKCECGESFVEADGTHVMMGGNVKMNYLGKNDD